MKLMGKWDIWLDRTIHRGATEVEMLGRGTWIRFISGGKLTITSFPVILMSPIVEKKPATVEDE